MKAFVALPLLLVLLWLTGASLWRKPIPPSTLRAVVALLLGFYLLTTAFLGLFWMSRMELPVFDWHYLMGYCLLVVALWHVWLEWPHLARFFKRVWEGAFPRWFLLLAGASGVVVLLVVFGGLDFLQKTEHLREDPSGTPKVPASPAATSPTVAVPSPLALGQPSGGAFPRVASQARQAFAYMSRESSASVSGLVRRGLFFGPKVPSLRQVEGRALIPLPPPLPQLGKSLPGALQWLAHPTAPRCGVPSLEEVATLLFAATGVTEVRRFGLETVLLRAAPSAGALYPVEVYLVSTGEGVAPGVYAYVPEKHGLLAVHGASDATAWARALGMPEGVLASGPLLVFTTVFQRTVWKYSARSYRYVALDAGHVAANFWLAAAALSWPVEVTPLFADPEVEALLGLSLQEEGAMAVAVFGRPPSGSRVLPSFAEVPVEALWDREELTRLSHRLTRWQWTEGAPWVWQPALAAAAPGDEGPDLLDLIKSRRSYRRFSAEPLSLGQLPKVCARVGLLAPLVPGGDGVEVRAVVVRDQGLAPGVYRWHPGEGTLKLVKAGNFGRALYRAGLSQELLERAGAALVFALNEELLASAFGKRGFRIGLLATGMLGEVVYLAAGEVGLAACGVGAFADDELSRLLLLPEGVSPVYLVALGKR